jgi:hypothetical protein
MSHRHSHHEHPAHHHHDSTDELSPREKLVKLLEHWIKHNEGHAQTYQEWAEKAGAISMGAEVEGCLKEAAGQTLAVNGRLETALKLIRGERS